MIALKHLLYATALAASVHAQLYAAPDGDGEACSQSTPCSLNTALITADAGASIKLAGAYVLSMERKLYMYRTASRDLCGLQRCALILRNMCLLVLSVLLVLRDSIDRDGKGSALSNAQRAPPQNCQRAPFEMAGGCTKRVHDSPVKTGIVHVCSASIPAGQCPGIILSMVFRAAVSSRGESV